MVDSLMDSFKLDPFVAGLSWDPFLGSYASQASSPYLFFFFSFLHLPGFLLLTLCNLSNSFVRAFGGTVGSLGWAFLIVIFFWVFTHKKLHVHES